MGLDWVRIQSQVLDKVSHIVSRFLARFGAKHSKINACIAFVSPGGPTILTFNGIPEAIGCLIHGRIQRYSAASTCIHRKVSQAVCRRARGPGRLTAISPLPGQARVSHPVRRARSQGCSAALSCSLPLRRDVRALAEGDYPNDASGADSIAKQNRCGLVKDHSGVFMVNK